MQNLTVIILTKNEEMNIEKCVRSFRDLAKRFVIVDSGSNDATKEICQQLNTELQTKQSMLSFYEHTWVNYADQMNWAITNTDITSEWFMRMDADEELTEELYHEIESKLAGVPNGINGIILRRRVYFMGRFIRHGGRYPEYLLRIIRTGFGFCEQKLMDEHLYITQGQTLTWENDFIDNNTKSLEWWTNKHNWYSNREVLERQRMTQKMLDEESQIDNQTTAAQAKAKRIVKNNGYYRLPKFFRAHLYFIYRYYVRLGFLDGPEGRIYHFLQAYWYRFLVDAKLFECEKKGIAMNEQGDLKA